MFRQEKCLVEEKKISKKTLVEKHFLVENIFVKKILVEKNFSKNVLLKKMLLQEQKHSHHPFHITPFDLWTQLQSKYRHWKTEVLSCICPFKLDLSLAQLSPCLFKVTVRKCKGSFDEIW